MGLSERQREYREVYLQSPHWQEMRKGALERAEHRCQVCNGSKQLDVHHRTYERQGNERPADLTVLCRRCHDLFHGKYHVTKPKPQKQQKAKKRKPRNLPPKIDHRGRELGRHNDELHEIQARNRLRREQEAAARETVNRFLDRKAS